MRTYLFYTAALLLTGCVAVPQGPQDLSMKVGPDSYLIEEESYAGTAKRTAVAVANRKCHAMGQEILVVDMKELNAPQKPPRKVEVMFRCLPKGHSDLNSEALQRTHARDTVPGKTTIAPTITNNSPSK